MYWIAKVWTARMRTIYILCNLDKPGHPQKIPWPHVLKAYLIDADTSEDVANASQRSVQDLLPV